MRGTRIQQEEQIKVATSQRRQVGACCGGLARGRGLACPFAYCPSPCTRRECVTTTSHFAGCTQHSNATWRDGEEKEREFVWEGEVWAPEWWSTKQHNKKHPPSSHTHAFATSSHVCVLWHGEEAQNESAATPEVCRETRSIAIMGTMMASTMATTLAKQSQERESADSDRQRDHW